MTASGSALGSAVRGAFDRQRLAKLADGLVVALAVSLPWSTSAVGIFAVLWLLAVLPTINPVELRRVLSSPIGFLPVLLFVLALVGMSWADVPFKERFSGVGSFAKLLFIPLLIVHFRRSDAGTRVMTGFVISCAVLLVVSWVLYLLPDLSVRKYPGVPVKSYSAQADMFTIAIFILAGIAADRWRAGLHREGVAYALAALAFIANILYIATSRTGFVVVTVLTAVFGFKKYDWKATVGLLLLLFLIAMAAWSSSFYLRQRIGSFANEIHQYRSENARTSAGERLEFWKKSIGFIAAAPVIGHGTGSIREQFRRAVSGVPGASDVASSNPHNQTLATGIQLGFVGIAALFAMWAAHLGLFFRGGGFAAWAGLVIVIQNVVGSLFNTALFDFTQGWAYVIGVGVAGGTLLRSGTPPVTAPNTLPSAPPTGLS